ncbi:MAG: hypothetical protein NC036_01765 [Muribaculaceae bacterium]|nr:hypothetical protein [Muribaculaceae bacterium]
MQNENEKSTDSRNLFYENVWLLLDNAELVLNTPALFYAPTHEGDVPDDMKYSKVGVWVEWWVKHQSRSRDMSGNPVVYFIGNPMTGTHSSKSVNRDGEIIKKCSLRNSWMSVMKSYLDVHHQYTDTPRPADTMTLRETIEYVKQHTTPEIRETSRQKYELYYLRDRVKYLEA